MKHLIRFNENNEEILDYDYIQHCFIDLIESGKITLTKDVLFFRDYMINNISTTKCALFKINILIFNKTQVENWVEILSESTNVIKDVKIGISKLQDEYPDLNCYLYSPSDIIVDGNLADKMDILKEMYDGVGAYLVIYKKKI